MLMRQRTAIRAMTTIWLLIASASPFAHAAELTVTVDDGKTPLADAVVSVHSPAAALLAKPAKAVMDQRNMMFAPTVLPVTAGTLVRFPNSDNIHHSVYSFSPAKRFELPLYAGVSAEPVLFDKTGVVTLGCNIHDWMVGYIVVLDTPYFVKTAADGKAHLDLPAGTYQLEVWHPQVVGAASAETVVLADGAPVVRAAHLSLMPEPPRSAEERMREFMKKKNRKSHPYH
jgi:plastocyanin